jgi:hypothetical protein
MATLGLERKQQGHQITELARSGLDNQYNLRDLLTRVFLHLADS